MGEARERAQLWVRGCQALCGLLVAGSLVVLVLPTTDCHSRERSMMSATMSNFKQVAIALHNYARDNDGYLPAAFSTNADLRAALDGYVKDDSVFSTLNPEGGEIVPNANLAGLRLESIAVPGHTALIYETQPWPIGGTLYAFVDSSFRRVTDVGLVVMEPALVKIPLVDTLDTPTGEQIEEAPLRN